MNPVIKAQNAKLTTPQLSLLRTKGQAKTEEKPEGRIAQDGNTGEHIL